jgi:molecular chaperone GrpE
VDLVYRKFEAALAGLGVRRLEAVGQPFDENLHEALAQQPSEEHPSGTVVTEVQPGYALGDRILRHARVIVAQ